MSHMTSMTLTIRSAGPADAAAIARLAELDSQRAPAGNVLLAEVGRTLAAALSTDDFHAVADPFVPGGGDLILLLGDRARQLQRAERRSHPRRRRLALPPRLRAA